LFRWQDVDEDVVVDVVKVASILIWIEYLVL
jgi:hypothetical protein